MKDTNFYTLGEEISNAITHGIGALLTIPALIFLIITAVKHGSTWHVVSFTVFGLTLMLLYLGSTLYHSINNRKAKRMLRIIDHSTIYMLIAGTYTPFTLTTLRGPLGWTILGIIWTMAVAGIIVKSFWIGKYDKISTLLYVIMGWMIVISIKKLWILLPQVSFILLVAGGIIYTLGAVLYSFDKVPYNHPLWHLFVLAGSACHFFSVINII